MRNHLLITAASLLAISVSALTPAMAQGNSGGNSNGRNTSDREFGRDRAGQRAEVNELKQRARDLRDGKDSRQVDSARNVDNGHRYSLSRTLVNERERLRTAELNRRSMSGYPFGRD